MILRDYQLELEAGVYSAWGWLQNILAVLPTGGGKTVLFANTIANESGPAVAIAHRQELVSQISLALCKFEIKHRIVGPKAVIKLIVAEHMRQLGKSYYDPSATKAVAGVDTLLRRADDLKGWAQSVRLWVQDEGHHVLRANKWGKAAELFPAARGLGVTATPERADGRGLGRHADGLFDTIVEGPNMRDLINRGYLTDYRIYAPPSDLDLSTVKISDKTGDYNPQQLKKSIQKSHVVGDIVTHYQRITPGKQGIVFTVDVETAGEIAQNFKAAGVAAEVVSNETSNKVRAELLRRFRNKELQVLVNVDLFGEGFDVPAVEVVSMGRPTESYGLYAQQFGRALRILEGKDRAIIIDHVGNVVRHGLPDAPRNWTLDRRERRKKSDHDPDVIPVTACVKCSGVYERIYKQCPYCGWTAVPAVRTGPEFVDGDLCELDAATLAAMRGEILSIDGGPEAVVNRMERAGAPAMARLGYAKKHRERQEAQTELRQTIAVWAGQQKALGRQDSESYRRFYFRFGTDVLTAQTLGRPEAEALAARIRRDTGC